MTLIRHRRARVEIRSWVRAGLRHVRERHRHGILNRVQQLHDHIGHVAEGQLTAIGRAQRRPYSQCVQDHRLPAVRGRHNKVRVHLIVAQIVVTRLAESGLHLVFAAQGVQSGPKWG